MKNIFKYCTLLFSLLIVFSCGDEDLEPTLAMSKDTSSAIQNDDDLWNVMASAYDRMTSTAYYGRNMLIMGDVRTDNMYSNMASGRFQESNMDHNPDGYGPWSTVYRVIAICNIVLQVDTSKLEGDAGRATHIQGQAYAVRALAHFDLLRMYGQHFIDGQGGAQSLGIPYMKTYKDASNLQPARDTVLSNVTDIQSDLTTAISMMSTSYDTSTSYMSTQGAYAIWARAALYFGAVDSSFYAAAGSAAKWVIDNGTASPASAAGFASTYTTDNASNSLFELAFSGTDSASINGMGYILRGTSYGDVRILTGTGGADDIYDVFAADAATDVRFTARGIIGTAQGYPTLIGKYPSVNGSDNITITRVEEMHLIYAEAQLRAGNSAVALQYLNNIPAIRGASSYSVATLDNILNERRKEFFGEGLRFYDLVRTGQGMPEVDCAKQLNCNLTGTPPPFGSYRYAYPIAKSERDANPNVQQNYGY